MKRFFKLILFCSLFAGHTDAIADELIKGDTYTMKMFDGWVPGTSEKLEGKIARRKINGYDATYTSRINMKEACSVDVLEYLDCKNGTSVLQKDSLMYATSNGYIHISWKDDNFSLGNVELRTVPHKHPETGKLEYVMQKTWYIQGEKSLYVITFSADDDKVYTKWLPKVKSLIESLKEYGSSNSK